MLECIGFGPLIELVWVSPEGFVDGVELLGLQGRSVIGCGHEGEPLLTIEWNRAVAEEDMLSLAQQGRRGGRAKAAESVQGDRVIGAAAAGEELVEAAVVHLADEATYGEVRLLFRSEPGETLWRLVDTPHQVLPVQCLRALGVLSFTLALALAFFDTLPIAAFAGHAEAAICCSGVGVDQVAALGAGEALDHAFKSLRPPRMTL